MSVSDRWTAGPELAGSVSRMHDDLQPTEVSMKSALLVIDAQHSFLKRPYWSETDSPRFIERLQMLIDRCVAQRIPVLQVFHVEEDEGPSNPFSRRSGYVNRLPGRG